MTIRFSDFNIGLDRFMASRTIFGYQVHTLFATKPCLLEDNNGLWLCLWASQKHPVTRGRNQASRLGGPSNKALPVCFVCSAWSWERAYKGVCTYRCNWKHKRPLRSGRNSVKWMCWNWSCKYCMWYTLPWIAKIVWHRYAAAVHFGNTKPAVSSASCQQFIENNLKLFERCVFKRKTFCVSLYPTPVVIRWREGGRQWGLSSWILGGFQRVGEKRLEDLGGFCV